MIVIKVVEQGEVFDMNKKMTSCGIGMEKNVVKIGEIV